MNRGRMSISEFSRRSLLSAKALRLYDEMGLLRPDSVDPDTGYRFYRESQLERARLISLLRKVDLPLARVAEVVAAPPAVASAMLERWWQDIEEEMHARRDLLHYVRGVVLDDHAAREETQESYAIALREVPTATMLVCLGSVSGPDLPRFIAETEALLRVRAERYGGAIGPLTVIFYGLVDLDNDGPVDVCLPIAAGSSAMDGDEIRTEAAHLQAYTSLVSSQVVSPQILQVYHAIRSWIEAQCLDVSGYSREIYLHGFSEVVPGEPYCEIAFPIRPRKGFVNV